MAILCFLGFFFSWSVLYSYLCMQKVNIPVLRSCIGPHSKLALTYLCLFSDWTDLIWKIAEVSIMKQLSVAALELRFDLRANLVEQVSSCTTQLSHQHIQQGQVAVHSICTDVMWTFVLVSCSMLEIFIFLQLIHLHLWHQHLCVGVNNHWAVSTKHKWNYSEM